MLVLNAAAQRAEDALRRKQSLLRVGPDYDVRREKPRAREQHVEGYYPLEVARM